MLHATSISRYPTWERELSGICAERDIEDRKHDNNGNLCSAGIRHSVALMALLHRCVHQIALCMRNDQNR